MAQDRELQKQLEQLKRLLEKNAIEAIVYTGGVFKIKNQETAVSTTASSAKDYLPHLLLKLRKGNLLNKDTLLFLNEKISGKPYKDNLLIQHPTITDEIKANFLYFELIQTLTRTSLLNEDWLNKNEKVLLSYLPELFIPFPKQITFLKDKKDTQSVFEALHADNINPRLQSLFYNQLLELLGHSLRGDESKLKQHKEPLAALKNLKERDKLHYNSKGNYFIKLKRLDSEGPDDKDYAALEAILNTTPKKEELMPAELTDLFNLYDALTQSEWFTWQYEKGKPSIKVAIIAFSIYVFDAWFNKARRFPTLDALKILREIIDNNIIRYYLFKNKESRIHLEAFLNRLVRDGDKQLKEQAGAILALLKLPISEDKVLDTLIENQIKSYNVDTLLKETDDKELALNDLAQFELKEANKISEIQCYEAFRKVVETFNQVPELDSSGINEKHLRQYIKNLIQGLSKKPKNPVSSQKGETEKYKFILSEEGKADIEAFISFLGKMNYQQLIYWGSLKQDINNLLDKYSGLLYEKYANDFKENLFNLPYMVSQELSRKKSFEEQIFTLELLIQVAEKARAKGNKIFYQRLRAAILSVEFTGINDSNEWKRAVSLKSQAFLNKRSLTQRLFNQKKYQAVSQYETSIKAKERCNNRIYNSIASETGIEKFRRKHQKKAGLFVGAIMAIGGSAFMFVSILPMVGFLLASLFGGASFIVNGYLFKDAVTNLINDGLFKVRGYPIRKKGMRMALSAFLIITTIAAMALGILTFSAVLALSAGTLGVGGAVVVGVLFGGVTWIANTALFTNPLKTLFAYLDKNGVNQALANLKHSFKKAFLSLEDCRFIDEEKTITSEFVNKRLLLQKICQLVFQSLFVLIGIVAGVIATVAFVGMLRAGVLDFISYSKLIGAQLGNKIANIAVRIAAMCSQLPLALSSAVRVFNQMGAYVGSKVYLFILGISTGAKLLVNSPKEALSKLFLFMIEGIKNTVKDIVSTTTNAGKLLMAQPLKAIELAIQFLWSKVILRVATVLNAIGSAFMSESGLYECKNYTRHFNDKLTSKATYIANGILAYVIPSGSLEPYISAKKKEESVSVANKMSFFEAKKITYQSMQKAQYTRLSGS